MHRPWETPTEPTPFVLWLRAYGWPSLILAVAWGVTGRISFFLDVEHVLVTPAFFFPEAFALAFALRFGAGVWPGIFVGHQLLILGSGLPVMAGLGVSAANTLEAVLAVWLFRRLQGKSEMDGVRSWVLLQAMIFLVLQPFCAALGTGSLFAGGVIGDRQAWLTAGLNWWSGSGMAQSQLAPLLLILLRPHARISWARQIILPALLTAAALAIALFVLGGGGVGASLVLFQPLLVAFALLLGLPAVCVASTLVSVAFLYATSHGWGPFYLGDATSLFDLNVFLIGISLIGQFLAVLFRQLAKQRKTEEELRDTREQLQRTAYELTEHIPVGTYVLEFDAKGEPHFKFLSERFLAMTGLKREEVMANHALALQPMNTAGREEIERLNREVFAKRKRFFWEGEITVRGEERNVTLESIPRSRPGGGTVWEGVITDVTERKRNEEREKELEAKHRKDLEEKLKTSIHAAAVAHEINQPLSSILLQSKMALQEEGAAREALRVVAEEAQRVVVTIDKMKTLMRNVQTEHRPVDLATVAQSALLYNKGQLARRRIDVQSKGLDNEYIILGDDAQLQLAITNLLRNAAEAIDESNPSEREIAVELAMRGDDIELTIGDSGPGWTGAERSDMPLTSTKKGGTGIGLYVVRTAVQNHSGKIEFGRSPLGGAEVKIKFPRAEQKA